MIWSAEGDTYRRVLANLAGVDKPAEIIFENESITHKHTHTFCQLAIPDVANKILAYSGHEQIIYTRSNHRIKQLMDWLSNPH